MFHLSQLCYSNTVAAVDDSNYADSDSADYLSWMMRSGRGGRLDVWRETPGERTFDVRFWRARRVALRCADCLGALLLS